eukprot:5322758-Prymnesium_polylepis.1
MAHGSGQLERDDRIERSVSGSIPQQRLCEQSSAEALRAAEQATTASHSLPPPPPSLRSADSVRADFVSGSPFRNGD